MKFTQTTLHSRKMESTHDLKPSKLIKRSITTLSLGLFLTSILTTSAYGTDEKRVPSWWYKNPPWYCNELANNKKLCSKGDAEACYYVGMAYEPHNYTWQRKEEGWLVFSSGVASYCPKVTESNGVAIAYFQTACDNGFGLGCLSIAEIKSGATHEPNAKRKALDFYEKGCKAEQSSPEACRIGGKTYAEGKVVRQDFDKARLLFKIGCHFDDAESCIYLGRLNEIGKGIWIPSRSKAMELYGKACNLGNSDGCENYARLNQQ